MIRATVVKENLLDAVIGLPANLFFGTGIPAALLIFDRSRAPNGKGDVLFIDASREFEQGTNQNKLRPQDIDKIVNTFRNRQDIEQYAALAPYAKIEENEFNLNIPRYVDTFEPEPAVDIEAIQREIDTLEGQLAGLRDKMKAYLNDLGFLCR